MPFCLFCRGSVLVGVVLFAGAFFPLQTAAAGQGSLRPILTTLRTGCFWMACRRTRRSPRWVWPPARADGLLACRSPASAACAWCPPGWIPPWRRTYRSPRCGTPPPGPSARSCAGRCPAQLIHGVNVVHPVGVHHAEQHHPLELAHQSGCRALAFAPQRRAAGQNVDHVVDVLTQSAFTAGSRSGTGQPAAVMVAQAVEVPVLRSVAGTGIGDRLPMIVSSIIMELFRDTSRRPAPCGAGRR